MVHKVKLSIHQIFVKSQAFLQNVCKREQIMNYLSTITLFFKTRLSLQALVGYFFIL